MPHTLNSFIKSLPGSKKLVTWLRMQKHKKAISNFLQSVYPVSTDRKLVRFGPNGDGGYLIPDDLNNIHACFSPGVSSVSGFEKDCAEKGIEVYLADASVDQPADQDKHFHFLKKYIDATTHDNYISMDDWVSSSISDNKSDLLLQMDIEGYEYDAILGTSNKLMSRFRIIVAEFHDMHGLMEGSDFLRNKIIQCFKKINETHACVHIHPNNCCGIFNYADVKIPRLMEFTFYRKDRITRHSYRNDFPHNLDIDNTSKPTITLPQCWYKNSE